MLYWSELTPSRDELLTIRDPMGWRELTMKMPGAPGMEATIAMATMMQIMNLMIQVQKAPLIHSRMTVLPSMYAICPASFILLTNPDALFNGGRNH